MKNLDFLSSILLDEQEFELEFSGIKGDFRVGGKIVIKEQEVISYPKSGNILNPKTAAWIRTHPKHWKILCGIEQADAKTNIRILGMLVRADLTELAEMMSRRVCTMI